MTPGTQTPPRPLVAVDLDGTLVDGNTLHLYIRAAIGEMVRGWRVGALGYTLGMLALRRLGLVSHRTMKFGIFGRIRHTPGLARRFAREAGRRRRADVDALIGRLQEGGYEVLLATAAPAQYVRLLWQGDFVATDMDAATNPGRTECRGDEKLRRVAAYAAARGLTLTAAVSDDLTDDAPLLGAVAEAYHVSPCGVRRL
jgi:phosphoserine phosphatase